MSQITLIFVIAISLGVLNQQAIAGQDNPSAKITKSESHKDHDGHHDKEPEGTHKDHDSGKEDQGKDSHKSDDDHKHKH